MRTVLSKVVLGAMITAVLLWIIVFALALTDVSGVLDMWAYILLIFITLPALAALLLLMNFIRRLLAGSVRYADRILFLFSTITTMVFAALTLIVAAIKIAHAFGCFDVESPYDVLYFDSALFRMLFAFAALALTAFLIGALMQFLIRKLQKETRPKLPGALRTTAIMLTAVISFAVLFIPNPSGTFNAGGSRIYHSVLYDVIDWNRTQEFDGTPFYEENQQMCIYWFPQNCYDYDDKWNLRH